MTLKTTSADLLQRAVDKFWEAIPPAWHAVRAYIRETATQDFDITVEQFHILRHVSKGLGTVSELAEAKQISRPAISQAVEVLVQKGLLRRLPKSQDRRFVKLELTEEGAALLAAVFNRSRQWMMEKFAQLSEEELSNLMQAFQTLHHTLTG